VTVREWRWGANCSWGRFRKPQSGAPVIAERKSFKTVSGETLFEGSGGIGLWPEIRKSIGKRRSLSFDQAKKKKKKGMLMICQNLDQEREVFGGVKGENIWGV